MSTWPLGYGRSYGMSARWPETPSLSQRSGSTGNSRPQATSANGKKSKKVTNPSLRGTESQPLPHVWFLKATQAVAVKETTTNRWLPYRFKLGSNFRAWDQVQVQTPHSARVDRVRMSAPQSAAGIDHFRSLRCVHICPALLKRTCGEKLQMPRSVSHGRV